KAGRVWHDGNQGSILISTRRAELNKGGSWRPSRGPRARPRLGAQISSLVLATVVLLKHQISGLNETFVRWRGVGRAHQSRQQLGKHFVLLIFGKRFERVD